MIITIDTSVALSPEDKALLALIAGSTHVPVEQYEANRLAADPRVAVSSATQEEEKPAPRRRAAPKKAAEPVAEEAPEEPLDETPAVLEDDTPAVLEEEQAAADDAPTLEDAVAAATPLISAGKAAVVKAALANAGVKRVGELPAEKIAAFIEELKSGE